MRFKTILVFLLFWFIFIPGKIEAQADPANELIALVNQLRTSYGFSPYRIDFKLTNVAQIHTNWLAANDLNTHIGPDGLNPDERAKKAGYGAGYDAFVIENIATGDRDLRSPDLVVSLWEEDPEKLNAMISPNYEDIGVGYVEAYGRTWYVMMVGWIDDEDSGNEAADEVEELDVIDDGNDLSANQVIDETGSLYHEVQPGESAWSIAALYQMDLWYLLSLNNLPEDAVLQPGEKLILRPEPTLIPSATPSQQPATETPTISENAATSELEQNDLPPAETEESSDSADATEEDDFFSDPFNLVGTVIFLVLFVIFLYQLIRNWF